jgi:hypothetical protein
VCLFINLVAAKADEAVLRAACERRGKVFVPSGDEGVLAVLQPGEAAWLTTQTCDCESRLVRRVTDDSREEEKLRKNGWSAGKIARWKEQRATHATPVVEAREHELATWRALVDAALAGGVARVGLVAHWASEDVRRVETKPLDSLAQDELVFWPG